MIDSLMAKIHGLIKKVTSRYSEFMDIHIVVRMIPVYLWPFAFVGAVTALLLLHWLLFR